MRRLVLGSLLLAVTPFSARAQETVEYYGTDSIGSIRVVFDQSGGITARTDYLPFGEELTPSAALPAERFTGQARDGEAGLDYFHARMFQARGGRFSTVDPVAGRPKQPQSWNRYAYVAGNPTGFADPQGLFEIAVNCGAGGFSIVRVISGSRLTLTSIQTASSIQGRTDITEASPPWARRRMLPGSDPSSGRRGL